MTLAQLIAILLKGKKTIKTIEPVRGYNTSKEGNSKAPTNEMVQLGYWNNRPEHWQNTKL